MGQLTTAQIIDAGLARAGRTDLTTQALTWLNSWLRSRYRDWPYPFLHRHISGVSLTSGSTSLSMGAGSGGVTLEIQRIFDPLYIYTSDYNTRAQVRTRNIIGGDIDLDTDINNPTTNIGLPSLVKVRANASLWGKWDLYFFPFPDRNYLLSIDYLAQPADISVTSDKPLYPNDRTLIQAVIVDALNYMHQYQAWDAEKEVLASMVREDRMKFGDSVGINDQLPLDSNVFR